MTAAIVGLGLIGGSLAKAYKQSGHRVLALDTDETTLGFAKMSKAVDGKLTDENIGECDLILIAVYPQAAIDFIKEKAPLISKSTVVIDCCGTKRKICEEGFVLAEKYGFDFVGGHPMAGTHNSGFKYARANLFSGAPMVIVPRIHDDMAYLEKIKALLEPAGFGSFSATTADRHDEIIAFTSQLAHVVSNAYVKSPTAAVHKGFSAGSYKDLTRVAWLNPNMWAELFLENSGRLLFEIDTIIESLTQYRNAISENDKDALIKLLDDGRKRKEEVDGK